MSTYGSSPFRVFHIRPRRTIGREDPSWRERIATGPVVERLGVDGYELACFNRIVEIEVVWSFGYCLLRGGRIWLWWGRLTAVAGDHENGGSQGAGGR